MLEAFWIEFHAGCEHEKDQSHLQHLFQKVCFHAGGELAGDQPAQNPERNSRHFQFAGDTQTGAGDDKEEEEFSHCFKSPRSTSSARWRLIPSAKGVMK